MGTIDNHKTVDNDCVPMIIMIPKPLSNKFLMDLVIIYTSYI